MRSFALSLMLAGAAAVASPAVADEANPDADRLLRVICYGVRTAADPSTRDPDFTIVVQQVSTEPYDASHFIEGNRNYREMFINNSPATINIFHDTQVISTETDPQALAAALLEADPTYRYDGAASRLDNDFAFSLHRDGSPGSVRFDREDQTITVYANADEGRKDQRRVYCEPPYSVAVE